MLKYSALIVIALFFNTLSVTSQVIESEFKAKLTPYFEVFDSIYYFKLKPEYTVRTDTLKNNNVIRISRRPLSRSNEETQVNSHWALFKYYYPNGNIQQKGFWYKNSNHFKIGLWYFFDKEGNLTDSINYDDGFDFKFEQVIEFTKKERLRLIEYFSSLKDPWAYRYDQNALDKMDIYKSKSTWKIEWSDLIKRQYITVILNGNSGHVESIGQRDMYRPVRILK